MKKVLSGKKKKNRTTSAVTDVDFVICPKLFVQLASKTDFLPLIWNAVEFWTKSNV